MKILMINVPYAGHTNPTLPLARELVHRGIRYLTLMRKNLEIRLKQRELFSFHIGITR